MAVEWTTSNGNVTVAGVTTIRWGTRGMFGTAIVESATEVADIEKIYVEQGDGMRATRFLLMQGHTYDFTVADDSSIFTGANNPSSGSNLAITEMLSTGSSVTRAYGTVVGLDYNAAKKVEGKRIIRLENMVLIDSQSAPGTPAF